MDALPYPDDLALSRNSLFGIAGFKVNSGSGAGGGISFATAVLLPYAEDDTFDRRLFPASTFKSGKGGVGVGERERRRR